LINPQKNILSSTQQSKGSNQFTWDASFLSAGNYSFTISTKDMNGNIAEAENELANIYRYHDEIISSLFINSEYSPLNELISIFDGLKYKLHSPPLSKYNHEYDQIVSWGEIMSTLIASRYLKHAGIDNLWVDSREFLITDSNFREAKPDWDITSTLVKRLFDFNNISVYITQGFIGSTINKLYTTLGREGSDYTAAIIANILDAESVTVWKDVPGLLNADPKWFDNTVKIDAISYLDAIELAYYGTGVIHPKTIQPLKVKNIPLYVKSFFNPDEKGSIIFTEKYEKLIPIFIFKMDQVLIHIYPSDYSFIAEDSLEKIFRCFSGYGLKINLMQNSAISFDVCVNNDTSRLPGVLTELGKDFRFDYSNGLELITIRYYDDETIQRVLINKVLILSQKSSKTIQMIVRNIGSAE